MTKPVPGALAILLVTAGLSVAQVPSQYQVGAMPAQTSIFAADKGPAAGPSQVVDAAQFAPAATPAVVYENTPGVELLRPTTPPSPEWVSARTSYYWFRPEALLWWVKHGPLPTPLVTTAPADSVGLGALGASGTAVLLGGSNLAYGGFGGGRLTGGFWWDEDQTVGLEVSGLVLQTQIVRAGVASDATGRPLLALPVNNAVLGTEEASPIAFPDVFRGSAAIASTSHLWGADVNFVGNCWRSPGWQCHWTAGLRYLGLQESLTFSQETAPLPGNTLVFNTGVFSPPSSVAIADRFSGYNNFFGGQFGLQLEYCVGRLFVGATGSVAVGGTHQVVNIAGSSTLSAAPGQTTMVLPSGFLALPTNAGSTIRNRVAVVPEGGVRLGYQLTSSVSVSVGYTCIYWSSVVRPGEQIDRVVNPTLVPTTTVFGIPVDAPPRPAVLMQRTDFWVQGVTLGLEWRF
jgi:hypothetical protein